MRPQTIFTLSIALFLLLLTWGLFSMLVYVGVPIHGAVLFPADAQESIGAMCDANAFFCRGIYGLFPFISYTIARAAPFGWYALLSVTALIVLVGIAVARTRSPRLRFTLTPWKAALLFLVSIWLLYSTLSLGKLGTSPVRRIVEPLPGVYQNVSDEGLEALQANFARLQENGCLSRVADYSPGVGVFQMGVTCLQKYFVLNVLSQWLFIALLFFQFLVLGRQLLCWMRVRTERLLLESILSLGLGVCGWIVILWLLAVTHTLQGPVGWALLALMPVALFRQSIYWGRQFLHATWTVDESPLSLRTVLVWLLVSYLALNFLTVVRPFPIGWDDLGSYLNRPRLMVSYGHFIHSMQSFQWEYLTSLGFLLFGYNNVFGATAAMMVNWMAGLLAVLGIYTFVRTFLGPRTGALSALLYYALPLVGHFSFADMKIDNAVFFMGTLATLCTLLALFKGADEEGQTDAPKRDAPFLPLLALAGVFVGFAFSTKVTAVMVMMALAATIAGVVLHWTAFPAAVVLAVVVFASQGAVNLARIGERVLGAGTEVRGGIIIALFLAIGLGFLAAAFWRGKQNLRVMLLSGAVFTGAFVAALMPWIYHNNLERGRLIPTRFELGAPNRLTPIIDIAGRNPTPLPGQIVRSVPPELALDMNHASCKATGHTEELDRYWGFREGWGHYLTLPWRTVMNLDSVGYYVSTMPGLLLFPLLLLLPFFWIRRAGWFRWLVAGTAFLVLEWMFMANGVPWYGIGMFLGLTVALEAFALRAPDRLNQVLVSFLITCSLFGMFAMRFWQFDQQRNMFEYTKGKASYQVMKERTIPHYNDIADIVADRAVSISDRPMLYRIGTFIPYFIPRNLEMIGLSDHQLDVFNCLNQERDPTLTVRRLKALGFNSIIFDTNTATIERDTQGSLHQKVQSLVDFVNDPRAGLQLVVNDPGNGVAFLLIPDNAGELAVPAEGTETP